MKREIPTLKRPFNGIDRSESWPFKNGLWHVVYLAGWTERQPSFQNDEDVELSDLGFVFYCLSIDRDPKGRITKYDPDCAYHLDEAKAKPSLSLSWDFLS
jgi:hypothetical protein